MSLSERFVTAKQSIRHVIDQSAVEEDLSHAENTLDWLLVLNPTASEILMLAAYGHDLERGLPNRVYREEFATSQEYKKVHSENSAKALRDIALSAGYNSEDAERLAQIVMNAEFKNDDPDVQLVCDADSISFFDNNLAFYKLRYTPERTANKMSFMYKRASARAQKIIDDLQR